MPDDKVRQLLEDLHLANPALWAVANAAREAVIAAVPEAGERVMYGGFMFSAPKPFCGVFAYTEHVSVEFGAGARLADPQGVLEGKGKQRRHIKLRKLEDIAASHLRDYVARSWVAASEAD